MTLERNAGDLAGHEEDFAQRRGFTYSVVSDTDDEVIGCVYIYPSAEDDVGADVRSWVRATRADLDTPVYQTVREWLRTEWPFDQLTTTPHAPEATQDAGSVSGVGRRLHGHLVGPQFRRHRHGTTVGSRTIGAGVSVGECR